MFSFECDYHEGAHQRVLLKLIETNMEQLPGYGVDHYSEEARELIKVTVQKNAPFTAREACDALCERVHAEPVQTIGNRFCIYRQARENSRIRLEDL